MEHKYSKRADYLVPSAIRELTAFASNPGVTSFGGGSPDPASFPIEEIRVATDKVLREHGKVALQYNTTEGINDLRDIIIEQMAEAGVPGLKRENILVTNGSQQVLDFLGRLYIDDGDLVCVENPSYQGAINAFAAFGAKYITIDTDEEGMRADLLDKALSEHDNVKFIYTVPTYQNPTGRVMSQKRRQEILAVAVKHGIPLVEDDPYSALYFEGERELPIKHYDKDGTVIYLGTFSKTFCAGLRIGWVVADPGPIRKFTIIKQSTDLHTSALSQMVLAEFIHSNDWEAHVAFVRDLYRRKRDLLMARIKECFPSNVSCTYPHGGLFAWCDLPENVNAEEVLKVAKEKNLCFLPGTSFYANGGHYNHIRLSYGTCTEQQIHDGIKLMGDILKEFCGE